MEENAYLHVDGGTLKLIDEKMPPQEELLDLAELPPGSGQPSGDLLRL